MLKAAAVSVSDCEQTGQRNSKKAGLHSGAQIGKKETRREPGLKIERLSHISNSAQGGKAEPALLLACSVYVGGLPIGNDDRP